MDWLETLATAELAQWMRFSRWGYAAVNTGHVLGIALLVGAILPLNLKLLGAWPRAAIKPLAQVLVPIAAAGLILAISTGFLLFLADPLDYVELPLFLTKLSLVMLGTLHALLFQVWVGFAASPLRLKLAGGISLITWLSVLVMGRFIAFVSD